MRTSSTAQRLPFEAEDALKALAERVRTVRKARGLTQPDLASKAGISTNTLVTMEKGGGSVQLGYRQASQCGRPSGGAELDAPAN